MPLFAVSALLALPPILAAVSAAALATVPLGPSQDSETLLVDLETTPLGIVPNPSQASAPVGAALGRLWVSGKRVGLHTPVFTVEANGEFEPFGIPPLSVAGQEPRALFEIAELPSGLALMVLQGTFDLWVQATDGTSSGTVDLNLSPARTEVDLFGQPLGEQRWLEVLGSRGYTVAKGPSGADAVFSTDGTLAGTQLEFDSMQPGVRIGELSSIGGNLIVQYRRDGGASELLRYVPGSAGPELLATGTPSTPPLAPLEVGGKLVFAWRTFSSGAELWSTDGTPGGTGLLLEIRPGSAGSDPVMLAGDGAVAYFAAVTDAEGRELWSTDGSAAGTRLVADIQPGPGDMAPKVELDGALVGGGIVFPASAGASGVEPWFSDGTATGTVQLADIGPVQFSSLPREFTDLGGRVAFTVAVAGAGRKVWITDGTPAGTQPTSDPNPFGGPLAAPPQGLSGFLGQAYYSLLAADGSEPVYRVDIGLLETVGTVAQPLGNSSSLLDFSVDFVGVVGRAYFSVELQANAPFEPFVRELWTTDGTPEGTLRIDPVPSEVTRPMGGLHRGLIYVRTWNNFNQHTVFYWSGNGDPPVDLSTNDEPAIPITFFFEGLDSPDAQLGDSFYFIGQSVAEGPELWRTDGTPTGTQLVAPVVPGPSAGAVLKPPFRVGNSILFEALPATGPSPRLWVSDGTQAGTRALLPSTLSIYRVLAGARVGEEYVFLAERSFFTDPEVWATDGTDAGTRRLATLSENAFELVAAGERVVVRTAKQLIGVDLSGNQEVLVSSAANLQGQVLGSDDVGSRALLQLGPGLGFEPGLHASDGTLAGTVRVADQFGKAPRLRFGSTDRFVLPLTEPESGEELWVSSGSEGTTELLAEVVPGVAGLEPRLGARAGGKLVFKGFTIESGGEPHVVDMIAAGAYVAEPFGGGCGSVAFPDLSMTGEARLGELVQFELADFAPGTQARLFLAFQSATALADGCALYLGGPLVRLADLTLDANGSGSVPVGIPALPELVGLPLFLQAGAGIGPDPTLGTFELSNGLELIIGHP